MQKRSSPRLPMMLADKPTVLEIGPEDAHRLFPWNLAAGDISFFHYHHSFELGLCFAGGGVHRTLERECRFSAGDALFVLPGQCHLAASDPGMNTQWIFVYIDPEELFEACGMGGFYRGFCARAQLSLYDILRREAQPGVVELISRLIAQYRSFAPGRMEMLGLLFAELLVLLSRVEGPLKPMRVSVPMRYGRSAPTVEWIDQALAEGVLPTCEELASRAFMSVSNFRKVFRKDVGVSPHHFIMERAVSRAQRMLLASGKSVLEISIDLGFRSIATFGRNFKRFCGVSPEVYRTMHAYAPEPPAIRGRAGAE